MEEMESKGAVRKVDELGRIVLPVEMRRALDIGEKDVMQIYVEGSTIILKKLQSSCIFCGENRNIVNYMEKFICASCAEALSHI